MVCVDVAAERAVLAGICKLGGDMYLDICDYVKVSTFSVDSNKVIFKCLDHICKDNDEAVVDLPSILSAANELGLSHIIERQEEAKHLNSIMALKVDPGNVRRFASKLRKLEVARLMHDQGDVLKERMAEIQGTESVAHILGTAEEVIFDFSSLLDDDKGNPVTLGAGLKDYLTYLAENPVEQIGISTGFPKYDAAIGGGLRGGTLNVIGARPKTGKTILTDNVGYYIAKNEPCPVLNLDTEMMLRDHQHRSTAMVSGVPINDIERGVYGQDPQSNRKVMEAADDLEPLPYYHRSIAGMPFEDQISLMRRWLRKDVGLNPDGTAKKCVIVYDYLKLMEANGISDAMREFQALGFMMSTLHNFAVRYDIPFLILMQLNRDGINREGTDTASGSDRIIWLCSNFTMFKHKSEEEIAEDGPDSGNRKMVVICSRHGEGMEFGEYLNMHMWGSLARIQEGPLKSELGANPGGLHIENDDNDDDDIPFN